jgi:hypothetical protein
LAFWIFAPLAVYLLQVVRHNPRFARACRRQRGDSRYVESQALQSLLWSLTGSLVALATCGLAIPVFMVWHVIAAIRAADGDAYEYPLVGALARTMMPDRG